VISHTQFFPIEQLNRGPQGVGCRWSTAALEIELWENVQRAYARSRCYRASDDPEYAKALAEFDRVANGNPASNVIQFLPFRGHKL
jgi:hypothetical protein